jgi:hypothetical protein
MSYFKYNPGGQNKEEELSGLYGRKKEEESDVYGFGAEA